MVTTRSAALVTSSLLCLAPRFLSRAPLGLLVFDLFHLVGRDYARRQELCLQVQHAPWVVHRRRGWVNAPGSGDGARGEALVVAARIGDDSVMAIVVWGIPSCGTVKKARAALHAAGVAFVDRDLRASPPTIDDVARFVAAVGVGALKNTSGGSYRSLGAKKDHFTDAEWIAAFANDPMLIKRPVIEGPRGVVVVGWKNDEALARLR
jgi:arsenate reductase